MKSSTFFFSIFVILVFFIVGCQTVPQARVVRAALKSDSGDWQVNVNGKGTRAFISSSHFTNQLIQLQLRQGDLIVFRDWPTAESSQAWKTWIWVLRFCASNRIAIYLYPSHQPADDLFSIPIYNWTAPFENPRTLSRASFFNDGKFLGNAMYGFRGMVSSIANTKLRKVVIVGSLYDMGSQFGPNERPYENQQDLLDQVLKKNGTELILLDPLP
jgi:hypothetical protein